MSESESALPEADRVDGVPHPRHARQLIGHEDAQHEFMSAVNSGRVHHAWMISGAKGIGKATLAWRVASYLLTHEHDGETATGSSSGATSKQRLIPEPDRSNPVFCRILALTHPDLFLCRRSWDEKRNNFRNFITVDEVRQLRTLYSETSVGTGWRLTIIDAIDDLNQSAANALLKLLEEPPDRALFLLVCHQPSLILPTIRSRCSKLNCRPLDAPQVAQVMAELGRSLDADRRTALAELSEGSPGAAVELADHDGMAIYGEIVRLLSDAPRTDRSLIDQFAESCRGRNNQRRFEMAIGLLAIALSRLARCGALGSHQMRESVPGEKRMWERLARAPMMAEHWATLAQELPIMGRDAHTVNLDPGSIIFDMVARINAAARHAPA